MSGTVRIGIGSDPSTLDPALINNIQDAYVASPVYETLVRRTDSGQVVGGLAINWDVKPDKATFTLRDKIFCSDGTPLSASAVAASLNRLVAPGTKSNSARFSFGTGTATAQGDDAANTVTVSLSKPWSDLLVGVAMPWTAIICPAGLADPASLATRSAGTGPYILDGATPGRSYTYVRRSDHTPPPDPTVTRSGKTPQKLVYEVVNDSSTMANALQTGQLDAGLLTDPNVERFSGAGGFTVESKNVGSSLLIFNQARGKPTADPSVRRALMATIDKNAFNRATWAGKAEVISSLSPAGPSCADSSKADAGPTFDLAKAKEDLAGQKLKIRVVGTTQAAGGAGTAYVQAALKEAGVDATLANTDTTTWATTLFGGTNNWDATVLFAINLAGTLAAVGGYLLGPPPPAGVNFANIDNASFSGHFGEATTKAGNASCGAWADAQRDLMGNYDVLPLSGVLFQLVWSAKVKGSAPNGVIDGTSLRLQ
ncbi:ABC transporter substrate-binding protein [Micromonospora sp. NBC_01392]|uniref:ABC transporter substrate-binding protein n=1 Tax=Micromonospora sp. NBC_01392 TaxID=2903588 RepID=UPI00324CBE71